MLLHRTSLAGSTAAAARGSSSRVRPFTAAANRSSSSSRRQQRLVARAAEGEEQPEAAAAAAEAEESEAVPEQAILAEDFDFNFSDAKKANQWQPSDVEAGLAYYTEERFLGGSADLPYEAEFVTNPLAAYPGGPEDSSWLADVDDSEAYERDEYALAGIPEAAPKMKRRDDEDEDNAEELRALEDEKIGASAFDDIEGLDEDDDPAAVWNWQFGEEVDDAELAATDARVGGGAAASGLDLLSSISDASIAASSELSVEQKDALSLLLDPHAADAEAVELIGQELPQPDDSVYAGLTQEEEAAIAAVLGDQEGEAEAAAALEAAFDLTRAYGAPLAAATAEAEMLGEEAPLDEAAVQAYLASLREMGANPTGGLDEATVKQLLGDTPTEEAGDLGVGLDPVTATLPAGLEALVAKQDALPAPFSAGPPGPEEAEAADSLALLADIEGLADEVDAFNEALAPSADDLREYEAFIDSALDYYDSGLAEAEGPLAERPQDAPINPFEDMDPALLGADAFGMDEEASFGDRFGTQFAERILELGRVTKVVKGGKLMGFRCVAVVGDGKGRVGVGCQAGREVSVAVKRALVDAKKNIVTVPLVGSGTIPHRTEAWFKAAGVVLQPAADGTGVIAGGAVRAVLELAGVQNVLGKRLGSRSTLNNARVTLKALGALRTMDDYAEARGVPLDYMLS